MTSYFDQSKVLVRRTYFKIFFENINKTVERSIALKKIWKDDSYFNARSMDVYIAKIRKYLSDEPSLKILTIHGEGFKLVEVN